MLAINQLDHSDPRISILLCYRGGGELAHQGGDDEAVDVLSDPGVDCSHCSELDDQVIVPRIVGAGCSSLYTEGIRSKLRQQLVVSKTASCGSAEWECVVVHLGEQGVKGGLTLNKLDVLLDYMRSISSRPLSFHIFIAQGHKGIAEWRKFAQKGEGGGNVTLHVDSDHVHMFGAMALANHLVVSTGDSVLHAAALLSVGTVYYLPFEGHYPPMHHWVGLYPPLTFTSLTQISLVMDEDEDEELGSGLGFGLEGGTGGTGIKGGKWRGYSVHNGTIVILQEGLLYNVTTYMIIHQS